MNQMGSSSPMDMDSESELFKISNCQYSFNELIVYIPIHGWQCKNLFGYRGEPLYELLLKWTYPSTFIQVPGFPKMGVPPKLSISIGCSIVDHPAIGVPPGPAIACIGISPGSPWVRIDRIDAVRLRRRLSEHVFFVMDIRCLWASSGRVFRKMCIIH